ncbi:MBL fold metallo-hydrolase [Ructibacterium gallinarum]|uniref:MBL fold metallo-hydrolase n=1 Tax=Ructibacterium gallinarum TaxID=2779355 RepID=A0A9D5M0I2_9FIRM|nr:MBL fold metallo-hydrolase [Ructibacterium gallinarum]MBE5040020.1 MBL fold metallo-hydrolase [Ructibacterium gallinarum]
MNFHKLTLGELGTNCYILADEKTGKAVLIDAPDETETILGLLAEHEYTLDRIILTHGHFDHILALPELKEALSVPVWIHENGQQFLNDGIYNLCHYVGREWSPISADGYLKDGDQITVGEIRLKILHTPGHTSDCICLLGDDFLLSGDTLFWRSVGRVDHPTGDLKQEIDSIQQKIMPLSDEIRVYPGHGPATVIGDERKENPYLR